MTTWLPVPGWSGLYEVSDAGAVRSLDRVATFRGVTRRTKGRTLRPSSNPKGYQIVTLTCDGGRVAYPVHRLVGEAFLGPKPDGLQTRHMDGDKANFAPANLRYGTPRENELDKVAHGGNHNANKTECPAGHPYDAENTMHTSRGRRCRTCHRDRKRAYDARMRAAYPTRAAA